jgi:hypothetical protein
MLREELIDALCSYQCGKNLSGIIYLHRISDVRMGGTAVRNFRVFRQLCGENNLKSVVIATTFWEKEDPVVCEKREAQLQARFFKGVLAKGAQLMRLYEDSMSAQEVVGALVDNQPLTLRIQVELVEESKNIGATAAGAVLFQDFQRQIDERLAELKATTRGKIFMNSSYNHLWLKVNIVELLATRDAVSEQELQTEKLEIEEEIQTLKNKPTALEKQYVEASEVQRLAWEYIYSMATAPIAIPAKAVKAAWKLFRE